MDMEQQRGTGMSREKKLLVQMGVSLCLGLALWGLNALPFPWAQGALREAAGYMQEDTDWEELGELSFVSAIFPEVRAVFAPQAEPLRLAAPVTGEQARGTACVAWRSDTQSARACADGRVFYAGEDRLYLLHEDGYQTRLTGLCPTVRAGARVQQGDVIGTVEAGRTVTLQLLQDGRELDPMDYLAHYS